MEVIFFFRFIHCWLGVKAFSFKCRTTDVVVKNNEQKYLSVYLSHQVQLGRFIPELSFKTQYNPDYIAVMSSAILLSMDYV